MKWRCFFKLEKWREKKRRLPVGKKKWGPESKATNFWPRVPSHKLTRQWMGQFPKISYEIHLKNQSGSIFPAILVYKKRVTLHPQVPPTVLENNEVSWFPQKNRVGSVIFFIPQLGSVIYHFQGINISPWFSAYLSRWFSELPQVGYVNFLECTTYPKGRAPAS